MENRLQYDYCVNAIKCYKTVTTSYITLTSYDGILVLNRLACEKIRRNFDDQYAPNIVHSICQCLDNHKMKLIIFLNGFFLDQSEVFMLQPFTSKDFAIRTLADRISDLKHLMYLFPDIPKDQAFGKYYTPFTESQAPSNGYVKPLLVTHVPGYVHVRQWTF